jgi:hypothetical protein
VLDPEAGPPSSEYQERVRPFDIRPHSRQRADAGLPGDAKEDAMFAPGVGEVQELELLPGEWVERMDDPKSGRMVAITGS